MFNDVRGSVDSSAGLRWFAGRRQDLRQAAVGLIGAVRRRAQWCLTSGLSDDEFFLELNRRDIRYAVLPWSELALKRDRTLAIIIDDDDLHLIRDIVKKRRALRSSSKPCEIYSTTGVPGYSYRDLAIFPPPVTERLLNAASIDADNRRRLEPTDRFLALAYYAAYLLGGRSDAAASDDAIEADIAPGLGELAQAAGMPMPNLVNFETLDTLLTQHGWRPPEETLERMAAWHPQIACALGRVSENSVPKEVGAAFFFIRQRAVDAGLTEDILELIQSKGYEILAVRTLGADEQKEISSFARGGNWGRGPWPLSGGGPAVVVAAFDVLPIPVLASAHRQHPGLDNGRILTVKSSVRDAISKILPRSSQYNPLHSTDNARQAWEYISRLFPEEEPRLRADVQQRRDDFTTKERVIKDLTNYGNRGKVEMIEYKGGFAIKKTFRASALRFLSNEVEFMEKFSRLRTEVPPVLERGSNYFIMPLIQDTQPSKMVLGRSYPRMLPLAFARQLVDFVKFLLSRGYDPIDLLPQNIMIDAREGLKIIDFEFVHRHPGPPPSIEESYCLGGLPPGFVGPVPDAPHYLNNPYETQWRPVIHLSLKSLIDDPEWLQRVKRPINFTSYCATWAVKKSLYAREVGAFAVARKIARRISLQTGH